MNKNFVNKLAFPNRDPREPQTVENKEESAHFLQILGNREIVEILEIPPVKRSVEPKVRLQAYGYNPFCYHSSRCLAVLV